MIYSGLLDVPRIVHVYAFSIYWTDLDFDSERTVCSSRRLNSVSRCLRDDILKWWLNGLSQRGNRGV
jgi:hypothetical protein